MHTGAIIWISVFAVFALIFFSVAAVVIVKGLVDLRDLLRHHRVEE